MNDTTNVAAGSVNGGTNHAIKPKFREALEHAINCHSMENGSNSPDFILAQYLADCLAAYDKAVMHREAWYGRDKISVPGDPVTAIG